MRNRLIASIYLAAFTALTLVFVWPIYQDLYLVVTLFSATALGLFIGFLQAKRNWSVLNTFLLVLVSYLVFVVPATNPLALNSPGAFVTGWIDSLSAAVLSWKQLITIDLPVGTYHSLLVPMFISFLVVSVIVGWVISGPVKRYWMALIPLLGLAIFAISFGDVTVPGDIDLLGLAYVPTALVLGFVILGLGIAYLTWSAAASRRSKLIGANNKNIFKVGATGRARQLRKLVSALLVIGLTGGIGASVMVANGVAVTRGVLRSGIDPAVQIRKQISPLSTYRTFFTNPELLDKELVQVRSGDNSPNRIRLAVMPFYDGNSFTVTPTTGEQNSEAMFALMPSDLSSNSGSSDIALTDVTVRDMGVIWLPLVQDVKRVKFKTSTAASISESFFMNRATFAGAIIPGTSNGVGYQIVSYVSDEVDPTELEPSGSVIDKKFIPESLVEWLTQQDDIDTSTADGIVKLAKRLRDRGYLSHALQESNATDGNMWMSRLAGYSFESSLGGHSMGRIGKMFTALNERASTAKTTTDKYLVSAIGDDEQFAAAIALIAAQYDYPSRVVIGFRTSEAADQPKAIGICDGGSCKGENLTAWVEVKGANGKWISIEATPQFDNKVSPKTSKRQDPKNPTNVVEDASQVLPPEKANPAAGESDPKNNEDSITAGWLLDIVLKIVQFALITGLLTSPFVLVLFMKRKRRNERETAESPTDQVQGAWEEFVDRMVDFGLPMPKTQTRLELVYDYELPSAVRLAELSDRAAFSYDDPSPEEVEEAWHLVQAEIDERLRLTKVHRRIAYSLSLRSFVRHTNPKEQLAKLQGAFNFRQSGAQFEGSPIIAFAKTIWKQVVSLIPKK